MENKDKKQLSFFKYMLATNKVMLGSIALFLIASISVASYDIYYNGFAECAYYLFIPILLIMWTAISIGDYLKNNKGRDL